MSVMPNQFTASAYDSAVRGRATRLRDWAADLWADKARLRRDLMIWGVAVVACVSLVLWLDWRALCLDG